jgi:hypothetical protein
MLRIMDIGTAIILNVIFHTWVFHYLETRGPLGILIDILLTFLFALIFLISIDAIKTEENTTTNVPQTS